MKQPISLLVLSLATLPGCGTKEKKEQPPIERQVVAKHEPIFHYRESVDDTTLPTNTTSRNSSIETTNESAYPKVGE
jgi:hypothetical protein